MRGSGAGRAEFVDAEAQSLFGGELVRWLAAELDERAELVKSNSRRRIYRVAHGGKSLFIKQHLLRGPLALVKCLLTGSPARVEYQRSAYAYRHGVPAVRLLARCERRNHWNPHVSITVAEELGGAEPLTATFLAVAAVQGAGARRAALRSLAASVARLCATAHDRAFLHRDAHPGNILVESSKARGHQCCYVDLQAVRCGRAVSDADAAKNLAALDQWFRNRTTRGVRLRFLKTYAALRRKWTTRAAFRAFLRRILAAQQRHASRLFRKRDHRIGRRNAFFDRQLADDGAAVFSTRRFRRAPELLGMSPLGPPPSASAPSGAEDASPGSAETFFAAGRTAGVAWRFAGSPAWRKYRSACVLMNRDLPTVAPLACRTAGGRLTVTQCGWRYLRPPDSATLCEWLDLAVGKNRSEILDAVGRLLADTLACGVVVRDPSGTHVEVAGVLRGAPRVYWAGVDVAAVPAPAPRHACVWMLARFAEADVAASATRADRARVLRACCRRLGAARMPGGWKHLWRTIAGMSG